MNSRSRKVRTICHMARAEDGPKVAYCGARPRVGIWGGILSCNCLRCLTTERAEEEAHEPPPRYAPFDVRRAAMRRVREAVLWKNGLWKGRTPAWFRSRRSAAGASRTRPDSAR
jgi:hypothetical protein